MSQWNTSGHKGYISTAAVTRGTIVKLTTATVSGQTVPVVVAATAATDAIIGVTTEDASAGAVVDVRFRNAQGTSEFKLGGTVAVGAFITSNGSGAAIATTTTGNEIVGRAVEAGVTGDFIEAINTLDRY
jgi:hypothetical protein